jgi:hypothetical protein
LFYAEDGTLLSNVDFSAIFQMTVDPVVYAGQNQIGESDFGTKYGIIPIPFAGAAFAAEHPPETAYIEVVELDEQGQPTGDPLVTVDSEDFADVFIPPEPDDDDDDIIFSDLLIAPTVTISLLLCAYLLFRKYQIKKLGGEKK